MMLIAFLEKLSFGAAVIALFVAGRVQAWTLGMGLIDLTFGILFLIGYAVTSKRASGQPGAMT